VVSGLSGRVRRQQQAGEGCSRAAVWCDCGLRVAAAVQAAVRPAGDSTQSADQQQQQCSSSERDTCKRASDAGSSNRTLSSTEQDILKVWELAVMLAGSALGRLRPAARAAGGSSGGSSRSSSAVDDGPEPLLWLFLAGRCASAVAGVVGQGGSAGRISQLLTADGAASLQLTQLSQQTAHLIDSISCVVGASAVTAWQPDLQQVRQQLAQLQQLLEQGALEGLLMTFVGRQQSSWGPWAMRCVQS